MSDVEELRSAIATAIDALTKVAARLPPPEPERAIKAQIGATAQRPTATVGIKNNYHEWARTQAELLRRRSADTLHWDDLAEEIEGLARTDQREIDARLEMLCQYLLEWQFQPEHRSGSWRGLIMKARNRIADVLEESPKLQPYPTERLAKAYRRGCEAALAETGLANLPESCPWTIEEVLDSEFWPVD